MSSFLANKLNRSLRRLIRVPCPALFRVIGTPDEWSCHDVPESRVHGLLAKQCEFIGMVIFLNRQMVPAWLKILADRQDGAAGIPGILYYRSDLIDPLSQAQHHSRFCQGAGSMRITE